MRIRESKLIYDGWTRFLVLEVEGPDGQRVTKAVLDHGESACVLPYDSERRTALLVGQQRVPQLYLGQAEPSLEAIAGRLEPDEAVEESIRREAEEEAGLRLRELEKVATCWASPGVSTERIPSLSRRLFAGRPNRSRWWSGRGAREYRGQGNGVVGARAARRSRIHHRRKDHAAHPDLEAAAAPSIRIADHRDMAEKILA